MKKQEKKKQQMNERGKFISYICSRDSTFAFCKIDSFWVFLQ